MFLYNDPHPYPLLGVYGKRQVRGRPCEGDGKGSACKCLQAAAYTPSDWKGPLSPDEF